MDLRGGAWQRLGTDGKAKAEMGPAALGTDEDKQWICIELRGSGMAKRRYVK